MSIKNKLSDAKWFIVSFPALSTTYEVRHRTGNYSPISHK